MKSTQQAYIGTYTDGDSEGLYTLNITIDREPTNVEIHRQFVTSLEGNPSFLASHPSNVFLYAVQEVDEGTVIAFRRSDDGSLRRLNAVPTGSSGPCHCYVHPSGEYLFVAHYTGGAVSVLPICEDGRVAPLSDIVQHEGSSVHSERQTVPHPHSAVPGPNGQYVYVPDLGADEIVVYELVDGGLDPIDSISTRPGTGPRHLTFHPNGRFAYCINELDSTLTAYEWTARSGAMSETETVSTLPDDYDGENLTADVHVHPSGSWVYASNRGHDSIAVFGIDSDSGELTAVDHHHTNGRWPRNFAFDETGQACFATNRKSNSVVAFLMDESTGRFTSTDSSVEISSPACICCLPVDIE